LHFVGCQRVYFGGDGSRGSIDELDFMIPYLFGRELIEVFLSEHFGEFGIFFGYVRGQYGLCAGSSEGFLICHQEGKVLPIDWRIVVSQPIKS